MTRLVDRGAVVAAYVGIGMAVTIGVSFLLVIPIDPIVTWLALPAGLLIGYYANQRAGRAAVAWRRVLANAVFAAAVTGIATALLFLGTKALFFYADDGYRDPGLGGRIACSGGADCVYERYRLDPQGAGLPAAGVTDVASFSGFYWRQQLSTAGTMLVLTTVGGLAGGIAYGLTRSRGRSLAGTVEDGAAASG